VVGKENRLQHFRRGVAIHPDAGLDGFLKLDGLFDGDERADFHFGQPLDRLDDDLDALALFADAGKERQVAEFGQHPAQFGLENHQHGHGKKRGERAEQPAQHLQIENGRHQRQRQEQHDKTNDHRPAARAAQKAEQVINRHREDQDFQRGPPTVLELNPHYFYLRASTASVIRTAWTVSATSWVRIICTPDSTASTAHARDAGSRAARSVPSNFPMNDLRETPSSNGRCNVVKLRRAASNCKLCSGVLPKPMPTSNATWSAATPQAFNLSSRPPKNSPTSRTTSA